MKPKGRQKALILSLRRVCATSLLAGALLCGPIASVAHAQSLGPLFGIDSETAPFEVRPTIFSEGYFDNAPQGRIGDIAVEADSLTIDENTGLVVASGNVKLSYQGYIAFGERAEYDRNTGDLTIIGNAAIREPLGTQYAGDRISITGDFRQAFAHAFQMQTIDGALITADEAERVNPQVSKLKVGSYAPCGLCIDEYGNKIGWRVRATTIVLDQEQMVLQMEQPVLEVLGIPILSLPYYQMPDPTNPRAPGFRFPEFAFSDQNGPTAKLPHFTPIGEDGELWLTPQLVAYQGFLLEGSLTHPLPYGDVSVLAAGIHQFNPSLYAGEVGDRSWRGAMQVSGSFTPIEDWAFGWSYKIFTDPIFTNDYDLEGYRSTNHVFAQHLNEDTFFDARAQSYILSGATISTADQDEQGAQVPVARFERRVELPGDNGQVYVSGDIENIIRNADHTATVDGVPFEYGYEGNKSHASGEAIWSKQFITDFGVVATPFVGARVDAASYDGQSALAPASSLFSATPIAALDLRFPTLARGEGYTQLFEPILQASYRGSDTSLVGVTNDNAQAFVFEDTNLFSFNRYVGSDRQETGLRVNAGGQYLVDFVDGSWVRVVAGQSFHVAGTNSYAQTDHANAGPETGLENSASHFVIGANANTGGGLEFAGKAEIDTQAMTLARAGLGAAFARDGWSVSGDYFYLAPQPLIGKTDSTHTIGVDVGVPLTNYWTFDAGVDWDLNAANWKELSAGIEYDDKYLVYGAHYKATQDLSSFNIDHQIGVSMELIGPSD